METNQVLRLRRSRMVPGGVHAEVAGVQGVSAVGRVQHTGRHLGLVLTVRAVAVLG